MTPCSLWVKRPPLQKLVVLLASTGRVGGVTADFTGKEAL